MKTRLKKQAFFFKQKSIYELEQKFSELSNKFKYLSDKKNYDPEFNFIDEIQIKILNKKLDDLAYQIDAIESGNDK